MQRWVNDYVDGCDRCKQTKIFPKKPHGPLKPNEIPTAPWQNITCDLIVDLPKSEGKDSIFVVVDRFSKQAHFIPTVKEVDSKGIAELFLQNVWKLHGTPKQVISDRGTQFVSKFMGQLSKRLDIKWSASTAYHPQTDGQTERVNQEVEQYLRVFSSYRQNDWVSWLPIAEFAHNNAITSTGRSPFKTIYGYNPEFITSPNSNSTIPAADEIADEIGKAQEDVKSTLEIVNERMKRFFDHGVKNAPQFEIGDQVWLDAKNIKQRRPSVKLSDRRLGPFEVLEKVGELNYKLKLPDKYKIHPVFHVSLLTAYQPSQLVEREEPNRPPPDIVDQIPEYEVEEILHSRKRRGRLQVLVRWKGYPLEEATWEPIENVKNAPDEIAEFYRKNPTAVKDAHISGSILQTPDFLAWRKRNIRPSIIRADAHHKKGVMSRIPNTSHYSFLNTLPAKPNPRTGHVIPSIPVTLSHISPFTSPQGSPTPKARLIALPL